MSVNGSVFIIHVPEDNEISLRLADALRSRGIDVWLELYEHGLLSVPPHDEIAALERCTVVLFIMTQGSLTSRYVVQYELEMAVSLRKIMIPIQLEDLDSKSLPAFIADLYRIDARSQDIDSVVRELLSALAPPAAAMQPSPSPPLPSDPSLPKSLDDLGYQTFHDEERKRRERQEIERRRIESEIDRRRAEIAEEERRYRELRELQDARRRASEEYERQQEWDAPIWEAEAVPPSEFGEPDIEGVPSQAPHATEQVICTAYHPKEVQRRVWESLLVYIAPDNEEALSFITADAEQKLGDQQERFRPVAVAGKSPLKHGAPLTVVPILEGFRFKPSTIEATWEEKVISCDFQLYADKTISGAAVNGSIKILVGPFLFAEIPLSIYVLPNEGRSTGPGGIARMIVRNFRKIFASYSHRDADVVMMCREAAEALDDQYLMDITLLHSGDDWDDKLLKAIEEADVFQLFWSKNAACSPNVKREWVHALSLLQERPRFIQPLYWSAKPYRIPSELAKIHFARLELAWLIRKKSKSLWQRLRRSA